MLDKTNSTSNEMPIGVAIVLTLVGFGLFFLCTLMWIGPALWVHFAYRPATATVLETRPTERSIKGGRLHGLKARIGFPVEGRTYRRWVTLPRESRRNEGPEAEAVRNQLTVGQQIPCFHDPFRPGTGAVLERTKLEWGMLFAVLFALAFVAGGAAGIVTSWERTFPRGVAVETAEVVRRLPRSFYLTLLGALAIVAVGVAALVRAPSEYGFLALVGTIAGVFVLVREAARRGAVAWPSPERRAARGRAVGHPTAGEKPARPALSAWTATEPVVVDRGDRLAVRLRPAPYSEYPVGAAGVTFCLSMVAGVIGLVLLKRASIDLEGEPGSLSRSLVISALFPAALAMAVLVWRRTARRVRGLAVEISGHPLRAGGRYEIVLRHHDPAELLRTRLTLFRHEEANAGDQRGGKGTSRSRSSQGMATFEDRELPPNASERRGHLAVPDRAVPSLSLPHHWVTWSLTFRMGGPLSSTVIFPVTVEASPDQEGGDAPPARKSRAPDDEDQELGTLWLDEGTSLSPGATLHGGYSVAPAEDRPLESVELSVLWKTEGPGWQDLGVTYYEDRAAAEGDDLPLFGNRRFDVVLPNGPPSYVGTTVKVRWLVRLRLRYAGGGESLRELPFSLGQAEA